MTCQLVSPIYPEAHNPPSKSAYTLATLNPTPLNPESGSRPGAFAPKNRLKTAAQGIRGERRLKRTGGGMKLKGGVYEHRGPPK